MTNSLVNIIVSTEKKVTNLFSEKGRVYSFLNPVSYLDARKNPVLFSQLDGIFADGSLLVVAIRMVYGKRVFRRSFDMTSLATELLAYADANKSSCYVVASRQEDVEKAVERLNKRYPNIIFIGYRNGFFISEEERECVCDSIISLNPDFLIVGMGIIKQEDFILRVKEKGFKGIGFTCGGFIHQTSRNEIDYYPKWIDRMNLRFIYRMIKEKHTRKRYAQAFFLFPIFFLYDSLKKGKTI